MWSPMRSSDRYKIEAFGRELNFQSKHIKEKEQLFEMKQSI